MDPYRGQDPWTVLQALVLLSAIFACLGTWPICHLLLRRYRRRIAEGMRSRRVSTAPDLPSAATTDDHGHAPSNGRGPVPTIAVREIAVPGRPPLLARARGQAHRAQLIFALAGAAYGLAGAVVFTVVGNEAWRPLWLLAYACVFAWPLVPTLLSLSMSSRRVRLIAWPGYLLVAAGMLALARPANLFDVALLIVPVVFVAATSARSLRGAAWLVAPVLLMIGVTVNAWRLVLRFLGYGAPFDGFAWGAIAVGLIVPFVALGYVRLAAHLYRSKRTSDQTLLIVQWWFVSSLWWMMLLGVQGGVAWLLSAVPYVIFVGLLVVGLRIRPSGRGVRLLLLRTFGARERSTRLVSVLTRQWRWIGSVELITAPDVASETLEPDEFLDFLLRRLSRRFVADEAVVPDRLAALDLRPDRDGRFRVNELMCTDDTWQLVFEGLVTHVDAVLIDLRDLGAARLGVRHELERVVAVVPLATVIAIVDPTTDRATLAAALQRAMTLSPASSPVHRAREPILWTVDWSRGGDVPARLLAAITQAAEPARR
ncbi:MAG TPA: hypothetical protein VIT41_12575 [Microlunatus sp.]